jgi:OOP family OmpA-OmpF porin
MHIPTFAWISVRALIVALATTLTAAVAAADDNDSGLYIGAGIGQFDVKVDNLEGVTDAVRDLDREDDTAWKVFLGWRFNRYIALEADYIDLGNPRGNFDASGTSGDYDVELAGFGGYLIGTLPITIFELSAKVGYYFHDLEINVDLDNIGPGNGDVFGSDESSEAFVYGVGAGVTLLDHINAKLEYEVMDIDRIDDANTIWLTGEWRF